jgi:5-methylcytosine-specific restriction endonuclease McrA
VGCARDSHGRILRSPQAKASFRHTNPCPSTGKTTGACRGYQIDHRIPLSKGGADSPSNMQWLTTQQHKAKTAQERR